MSGLVSDVALVVKKHIPLIKFRSQLKSLIKSSSNSQVQATSSTFVVKSSVPREAAVEPSAISSKFRRKKMTDDEVASYERALLYD
ncbi:unnamed protein product [Heterobilharzia americana]|nr:unnamed protein product [Heterobilharzia americana]